jgi:beta-RFAP synthase
LTVPKPSIEVTAASRLHFGLFAFGCREANRRNFGGVGMMVREPRLRLSIMAADRLVAVGPYADRVRLFAKRWSDSTGGKYLPECHIKVSEAPPEHAGLGVGTQLGLSVAAGLNALFGCPTASPQQLAQSAGRGARSAVGVYGFHRGGLIVEDGKCAGEQLSPLLHQCEIPADWRIVLMRPPGKIGLSGRSEINAFAKLPAVVSDVSTMLRREVADSMLPALKDSNFDRFSRSVYRFGRAAGECFAAAQGGPYNGALLMDLVRRARRLGVEGVGQSSWGPTIYCLLPNNVQATDFVSRMREELHSTPIEFTVTSPCNRGAVVKAVRESASTSSTLVNHKANRVS